MTERQIVRFERRRTRDRCQACGRAPIGEGVFRTDAFLYFFPDLNRSALVCTPKCARDDRTLLISEGLSEAEAEEGLRRLTKGGTGVRDDRRPIPAVIRVAPDGSRSLYVLSAEDATRSRELLDWEGWPVVWD